MTPASTHANGRTARQKLAVVQDSLHHFLKDNTTFLAMTPAEQKQFYTHALTSGVRALDTGTVPFARGLDDSSDPGAGSIPGATGISQMGSTAANVLAAVDFPKFVRDLITGTYGSIVESTIQQMNAYVDMYKKLAAPLGEIAKSISETDAQYQMAANDPVRFSIDESGSLMDNNSQTKVDVSTDAELQKLEFQAKLELAKERRLLLRETMLMGVARLVVDSGTISAGLYFDIKPTEHGVQQGQTTDVSTSGGGGGLDFFGLFGASGGGSDTTIKVSTRSLDTNTTAETKVTGNVTVNFKSDYFKLDNFADLFGDESTKAIIAEHQGQASGATPQLTVPAAAAH